MKLALPVGIAVLLLITLTFVTAAASAQQVAPPTTDADAGLGADAAASTKEQEPPSSAGTGTGTAAPPPASTDDRLRELEAETKRLREELETLKDDHKATSERVDKLLPLQTKFGGYFDFGLFIATGNGSGIRSDNDFAHYPEFRNSGIPGQWVFYGDPLATMVNARGEPADTGESRAITFDPIHNGGKPSFIVNSLNFNVFHPISESVTLTGSVDFVPRSRNVSLRGKDSKDQPSVGDFIDVKLAYAEYIVPTKSFALSLYAGKIDSVLGVEYRTQDAPDRLAVTPSLICRYTCGRPLGVKARAKIFDEKLVFNASVTNGSHFVELFPFYSEIDTNNVKTVAGRLSYDLHLGKRFEIGASGAWGAQDFQTSDDVYQWQIGADLSIDWKDILFTAEWVHGIAKGAANLGDAPCTAAPCLHFTGAYGQLAYRLLNWLTPYARVDVRDAFHRDGTSFVYNSTLMRTTGGFHFELGPSALLKMEYTHVQQLGRSAQFPSDVATSALVLKF